MKLHYRDGLLFTTLRICHRGKDILIENIVLDTGASHTIISPDAVESIGITIEDDDMLVTSYGVGGKQFAFVKMVDKIKFNTFTVEECYIDFGVIDMDGKINGLLGLDLLMKAGVIIDMKNLLLYEGI
ncbi:hypothetical protein P378_02925 [Desulforamulus profundi]|uniref:Aspartyl protease n=1 Tax=Desulforamulus profundi TaxID=1383067 RepID=A0A2C6MI83_9FIRM|nr:retropepsin-like aspartic protease [Desulforamulus profundi]PHJ39512.1 hypothetical protein P378_02925 [Desulforamulus profundi]